MIYIPGFDPNKIVDGKTLGEHWKYWTVNVKYLNTLTHEQFCQEFPNAAEEIAKANETLKKMDALFGTS